MASWVAHTRLEGQQYAAGDVDNCCFVDRQCQNDQDWVNGYWAYQNGQCGVPTQSQVQTSVQPTASVSSEIDNCCFAGWPCHNDQDWVNGYWAYQSGQCGGQAQAQSQATVQLAGGESTQIDNCCFGGRQCHTDQDWVDGYLAYQSGQCGAPRQDFVGNANNCCQTGWNCVDDWDWANGQWAFANNACTHPSPPNTRPGEGPSCCFHGWNCTADYDWLAGRGQYENHGGAAACGSPLQETYDGVIIEGSATFIARVKRAFDQIRRRSPEWYAYSITASHKIREALFSGTLQRSWNLTFGHTSSIDWLASVIVHESCHQQRWLVWVWRDFETEWLAEEPVCDTVAINAARVIAPGLSYPRGRINEFLNLGIPFDVDASANREWERAKLILSRRG